MKNNLLKYYITAAYLCSAFVAFSAVTPGGNTADGSMESADPVAAPMPIDNYVWVMALVGLVFVFLKFRAIQKKKLHS